MNTMNRVALVTGSSRGIGRAIAAQLAREGYAVGINYYERRDKAEELAAQLAREGCRALAVQADVSKRDEVNAMVKRVEEAFGPISVLVNNAGVAGQALFQDVTDALWERYFAVNLNGARNTIQAVLPYMLHEKAGVIVNISSVVGEYGNIGQANYAAAKAGVIGLTKTWAKEFARKGAAVRVNCIAPGYTMTDMLKTVPQDLLDKFADMTMLKRLGRPEEIASAALFLVSEEASYVTGQVLSVNGGMRL